MGSIEWFEVKAVFWFLMRLAFFTLGAIAFGALLFSFAFAGQDTGATSAKVSIGIKIVIPPRPKWINQEGTLVSP